MTVTPARLRTMYGIPGDPVTKMAPNALTGTTTSAARQAFVTFAGHEFAVAALASFNNGTGETASVAGTIRGSDLSLHDASVWMNGTHNGEPNLDAQYISSIAKGAATYQWFVEPGKWWLGFAQEVLQMGNATAGGDPAKIPQAFP